MTEISEVMNHSSIRELFINGTRLRIQEILEEDSKNMIEEMNRKIKEKLSAIAKEAAEKISVH